MPPLYDQSDCLHQYFRVSSLLHIFLQSWGDTYFWILQTCISEPLFSLLSKIQVRLRPQTPFWFIRWTFMHEIRLELAIFLGLAQQLLSNSYHITYNLITQKELPSKNISCSSWVHQPVTIEPYSSPQEDKSNFAGDLPRLSCLKIISHLFEFAVLITL